MERVLCLLALLLSVGCAPLFSQEQLIASANRQMVIGSAFDELAAEGDARRAEATARATRRLQAAGRAALDCPDGPTRSEQSSFQGSVSGGGGSSFGQTLVTCTKGTPAAPHFFGHGGGYGDYRYRPFGFGRRGW